MAGFSGGWDIPTNISFLNVPQGGITILDSGANQANQALTIGSTVYNYLIQRNVSTGFLTFSGNQVGFTGYRFDQTITVAAGMGLDASSAGALLIGTTTATTVTIGRAGQTVVISSNMQLAGTLDTQGNAQLNIGTANAQNINLARAGFVVNFGSTAAALGGGAAATLGTIGGTGPAAAAQNSWLPIQVGGVNRWIPVWA